jgi:hypothetical protein
MRRFFLALRVGGEHVAGALPDVLQLVELPPDGCRRDALAPPVLQMLLQKRDGPLHRLIAEVTGPPLQGGGESHLEILGPKGGVIAPALVCQAGRVVRLLIAVDPVVDADPTGAEESGDLGDGAPGSGLQDGQGAAEETGITGTPEWLFELASLCRGQLQATHGIPR